MDTLTTCPDRERLEALVRTTLPPADLADLTRHLDACEACRQRLEEVAGNASAWLHITAVDDAPIPNTIIRAGIAAIDDDAVSQPMTETDLPLNFLEPSDRPDALGRLGSYEVTGILGRGGMGIVLQALDLALNRHVAIKVLAPQWATNAAARKRFAREAQAAAAVSHDHVVAIHAVEEAQGLPYLVMQYIGGTTLQALLDQDGPPEPREIVRIGMQIAAGLTAAHAQGLIHRDIKPANILLENGVQRVKITDFGLARAVDDVSLTQNGVVAGTPEYMAPEQARGEPLDGRADLFSLGSVLYALCTGRPPFRGDTTSVVLRRVEEETPRAIEAINPEIPGPLIDLIDKLLAKNPADRYQTAGEVADVLCQYLAHLQQPTLAPLPPALSRPVPERSRWLSRRSVVAASLFLAFLGGLWITEATGQTEMAKTLATVFRIRTADGTLVVEVDDPQVKVTVDDFGKEVVITGAGVQEIRLRPGVHQLKAEKDGHVLQNEEVTITRGGKQVVRVSRESSLAWNVPPDRKTTLQGYRAQLGRLLEVKEQLPADTQRLLNQALQAIDKLLGELGDKPKDDRGGKAAFEKAVTDFRAAMDEYSARTDAQKRETPHSAKAAARPETVWGLAFSPDGKRMAAVGRGTGASDGAVMLWNLDSRAPAAKLNVNEEVTSVAFSPDGKLIATSEASGAVKVRDAVTGALRSFVIGEHSGAAWTVQFAPDGKSLASGGDDRHVILWDLVDGTTPTARLTFPANIGKLHALAFSPDGHRLIGAGSDHLVRLWDVQTGKERMMIAVSATDPVRAAAFSPDGKVLATGAWDHVVKLFDVASGRSVREFPEHPAPVQAVVFSPDGKTLATACGPYRGGDLATGPAEVRLYDLETGQLLRTISTPADCIFSLKFSPDGQWLAAAGAAGKVHLWNVAQLVDQLKKLRSTDGSGPWIDSFELSREVRTQRHRRWSLLFDSRDGDDYLAQLHELGAFLAVPQGDGKHRVYRQLGKSPFVGQIEDIKNLDLLYWVDDDQQGLAKVTKSLGLTTPPVHVVVFFPVSLEQRLQTLERQHFPGREESAGVTFFRVVRRGQGLAIEVVGVRPKAEPGERLSITIRQKPGGPEILLNEKVVALADLTRLLQKEVAGRKDVELLLDVSNDVQWDTVVRVRDAARAAGIGKEQYQRPR